MVIKSDDHDLSGPKVSQALKNSNNKLKTKAKLLANKTSDHLVEASGDYKTGSYFRQKICL